MALCREQRGGSGVIVGIVSDLLRGISLTALAPVAG